MNNNEIEQIKQKLSELYTKWSTDGLNEYQKITVVKLEKKLEQLTINI